MNTKIYVWTIIISVALLILSCFWSTPIFTLLSGIGCSGLAAAIMAIFLESADAKRVVEKKARTRTAYFEAIKEELKIVLERILWFDMRTMDENFDWEKEPAFYSTMEFILWASETYPEEEEISFQAAEKRLNSLAEKYAVENLRQMSQAQLEKTEKPFLIVATGSTSLLELSDSIEKNKIVLDAEDYISLKDIKSLSWNISISAAMMSRPRKNYGAAISMLLSAYKLICSIGNYSDDFLIGMNHGNLPINELLSVQ